MKRCALFMLILISFNLVAMQGRETSPENVFHKPEFQKEAKALVDRQVSFCSVLENVHQCAFMGGLSALLPALKIGECLASRSHGGSEPARMMAPFFLGAGVAILGAPIEILFALPLAAGGACVGIVKSLIEGIDRKKHRDEVQLNIALHLYQWMQVIKEGRFALRNDIKKWQQDHEVASLKEAALEIMNRETFKQYFGDSSWTPVQFVELIKSVPARKDNWGEFFKEVSNHVKVPFLSLLQWNVLVEKTKSYRSTDGMPELSDEDIAEYLPFASYFFSLSNQKSEALLKSFIN